MKPIDLRSDTVTKPTPAMRAAIATAEVGADVYGADPTVNALQERIAAMLGFEAALFVPSGTMSNLCALMSHCARGDEYIVGQMAHTYRWEGGGAAVLGSIQPQPLAQQPDGSIPLAEIEAAIKPDDVHYARSRLLALENTWGGQVLPLPYIEAATALDWRFPIEKQLDRNRRCNGNNVVHHNLLHDSGGYGPGRGGKFEFPHYSWGIYLDLACSGWRIHDNIVWNTVLGGFMLNAGVDNTVENNIFVAGKQNQVQFNPWPKYPMSGHRCERNIISYDGGAASLYTVRQITTDMCRFSRNLIHCAGGPPRVAGIPRGVTQANWSEWLAMGQDRGSVLAEPKFVNAAARDYRLQPDSPALQLGIRPVDLRGAGNYASPERRTWPRPEMEVLREPADYQPATTLELQQPALRTYEDYALGESERGAAVGAEAGVNSVAVTDETAVSGKHSLKISDGAGPKPSASMCSALFQPDPA